MIAFHMTYDEFVCSYQRKHADHYRVIPPL